MKQMSQKTSFRINVPRVVHQTIDGETIIIDFENGSYFSIDGAGVAIWEQVADNASVKQIIYALNLLYTGDQDNIEIETERFLNQLKEESLIVLLDSESSTTEIASTEDRKGLKVLPLFEAPTLHKYTDMQDLLLLDPIHDVDEHGWPIKKDAASE